MKKWTNKEIEILTKYYPLVNDKITIEELEKLLSRTWKAILNKAYLLKLNIGCKSHIDIDLLGELEKRIEI